MKKWMNSCKVVRQIAAMSCFECVAWSSWQRMSSHIDERALSYGAYHAEYVTKKNAAKRGLTHELVDKLNKRALRASHLKHRHLYNTTVAKPAYQGLAHVTHKSLLRTSLSSSRTSDISSLIIAHRKHRACRGRTARICLASSPQSTHEKCRTRVNMTLQEWLTTVPQARRQRAYWSYSMNYSFSATADVPLGHVLELSAGRVPRWSRALAARGNVACVVAGDIESPNSAPGVTCIALDNTRMKLDNNSLPVSFDLIFGSHALCTCEFVTDPLGFLRGAGDGYTCGGISIEAAAVDDFVASIAKLLKPQGLAIFDQEGGWPFGLEKMLREAASRHGLTFYVRRGPLSTNFNYILARGQLEDDVSSDPLQQLARLSDLATVVLVTYPPDAVELELALVIPLFLFKLLPFFDFLTVRDFQERPFTALKWASALTASISALLVLDVEVQKWWAMYEGPFKELSSADRLYELSNLVSSWSPG
eukprot:gnl/TRDRNA2_/TRDRNA2_168551_c1_seq1.p1 gnl/TRDRNA2_/TRDRNA2_168551_c1~~gnl/TRDRNA2_/TRDRNA2_168551_c1_seq1.p1  ORF type:complete len:478 (+),score=47.15 gnl/TRDRNA2_/TRDRNA2_168551_c1_seq1:91-1524(+)